MKIQISTARKRATKDLFYHGTSTKFLRSILKHGLVPNPKEGYWKTDPRHPGRPTFDVSRKSYSGVYLTKNFLSANSAASNISRKLDTNNLFVCVQGQPRSGYHDEDSIMWSLKSIASERHLNRIYLIFLKNHFKEFVDSYFDKFMNSSFEKNFVRTIKESLERSLEIEIPKVVNNTLYRFVRRFVDWMVIRYTADSNDWIGKKQLYDKIESKEKAREIYEYIKNMNEDKAEDAYRKEVEKLTKSLKFSIPQQKDHQFTFRVVEPITYRGANRIVCIFEAAGVDRSKNLILHYGKPPAQLKEDIKQFWGSNYVFVGS